MCMRVCLRGCIYVCLLVALASVRFNSVRSESWMKVKLGWYVHHIEVYPTVFGGVKSVLGDKLGKNSVSVTLVLVYS